MSIFPTKILLATDGSVESELVLNTAVDLANSTSSELHVVRVGGQYHPDLPTLRDPALFEEGLQGLEQETQEVLDGQARKIEEAGGTVQEAHYRRGRKDQEIVHLGEEIGAGLIVMGSRGRGGVRRALMGSVSDSVIRHAHCPFWWYATRSTKRPAELRSVQEASMPEAQFPRAGALGSSVNRGDGSLLPGG